MRSLPSPALNCRAWSTSSVNAGVNDIDNGLTSMQSPSIVLPAGQTALLTFRYYLGYINTATSADYFRVRVVGNVARSTSRLAIRLYDVAIVVPLLIERLVQAQLRDGRGRRGARMADVDVDIERTHA